jgi:hypothetical protein
MRKKLAVFLAAAFVVALVASPAMAAKPAGDGRAGSTIIARS